MRLGTPIWLMVLASKNYYENPALGGAKTKFNDAEMTSQQHGGYMMLRATALILLLSTKLSLADNPLKYHDALSACIDTAIHNYVSNSDEPADIIAKAVLGKCRDKNIVAHYESPRGKKNLDKIHIYVTEFDESQENIIISKILDMRILINKKGSP